MHVCMGLFGWFIDTFTLDLTGALKLLFRLTATTGSIEGEGKSSPSTLSVSR